MTNVVTLFGGKANALVGSDLFKSLMDLNKTLAGNAASGPRISIRGGRFREIIGGEQTRTFKGDQLNVVIVNAAPIARTYFEGAYDPNASAPPTCWSADTKTPSPDVPKSQVQSASCGTCPMNIKGSGTGESRACRFSQRLAVTVEGDESNTVYQMQLPATSIFGENKGGQMGMQAYAKVLAVHDTPAIAVVTGISFDEDAETPKLFFKPVRPLTEEELMLAVAAKDSPEALAAVTTTVSAMDGVVAKTDDAPKPKAKARAKVEEDDEEEAPKPKAKARAKVEEDDEEEAPKPKAKPKAKVEEDDEEEAPKPKAKPKAKVEEDDEDEAPVKRTSKTAEPAPKKDLSSIISQWDDDED